MKVLILGGGGMLGHKVWQVFRQQFETCVTFREDQLSGCRAKYFDLSQVRRKVDASNFETVVRAFADVKPEVVVNCIGIVKQLPVAKDPIITLTLNSLFPHLLAQLCAATGAWLIQISTDCIFSGKRGGYTETDTPDPVDLYGRTKLLGEIETEGCLTLRTSMFGRELETNNALLEWFLSTQGQKIQGYTRAIFSGFTTLALSSILADLIKNHYRLSGLYHLSADPISKYELLVQLRQSFGLDVEIEPFGEFFCDRSLDSSLLRTKIGLTPPSWEKMIEELVRDNSLYKKLRG